MEQGVDKALLVNGHGNRFADSFILHQRTVEIHPDKEGAACSRAANRVLVVLKQGIAGIGHAVGRVDFAGLQGHSQRIAVGNSPYRNRIQLGLAVPIGIIFYEVDVVSGHEGHGLIRPRRRHHAVAGDAGLHVDDAAVWVGQIIGQGRHGNRRPNRQHLSVRFHRGNMQIAGRPLMDGNQMLQTFLDGLGVYGPAAGKGHIPAQDNPPRHVVDRLIAFCQPRLNFHRIGVSEQRLPYAVADTGPAAVVVVRIDVGLVVFRVKGRIAHDKGFASGGMVRLFRTAAAGRRQQQERRRNPRYKPFFIHPRKPPHYRPRSFGSI